MKIVTTSLMSLLLIGSLQAQEAPPPEQSLSRNLEAARTLGLEEVDQFIRIESPDKRKLAERLKLEKSPTRDDAFGNSHVDLAPKAWPYPMVVSPGRPVLPGSAW